MKAIRIIGRSIRDSFKSVFRNFSLSVASIACTTITLVLVSLALIFSYNVNNNTNKLESELTIVVYLERDTTTERALQIKELMENLRNVKDVSYKSKDEWKLEMQESSQTLDTTLDYLETNPLLDSFLITVKDVNDLKKTTAEITKIGGVKTAEYGEGMVEQIISAFDMVEKVTYGIVLGLIFVTAFLISNTIKLTIFSRKNEIEIMRLVGTSNIAIKLPFLFEGFVIGVVGSVLPIIVSIYGYIIFYEKSGGYVFTEILTLVKPFNFIFAIAGILLLLGSLIGTIASFRSVRKYLKV